MKKVLIILLLVSNISSYATNPLKEDRELFNLMNNQFHSFVLERVPKSINFDFYPNWDINYPAAAAERDSDFPLFKPGQKDSWTISTLSGYWRDSVYGHPIVHLLVLCHELAHHIGGEPYKHDDNGKERWASMEAQADYYALKTCVPKFLENFPMWINKYSFNSIHPVLDSNCNNIYFDNFKNKICKMSSQASLNLARIHQEHLLPGEVEEMVTPYFEEDKEVMKLDRAAYPSSQCRYDTQIRGALGMSRPKCWFPN